MTAANFLVLVVRTRCSSDGRCTYMQSPRDEHEWPRLVSGGRHTGPTEVRTMRWFCSAQSDFTLFNHPQQAYIVTLWAHFNYTRDPRELTSVGRIFVLVLVIDLLPSCTKSITRSPTAVQKGSKPLIRDSGEDLKQLAYTVQKTLILLLQRFSELSAERSQPYLALAKKLASSCLDSFLYWV